MGAPKSREASDFGGVSEGAIPGYRRGGEQRLARPASAVCLSFHADLRLLAECRRERWATIVATWLRPIVGLTRTWGILRHPF